MGYLELTSDEVKTRIDWQDNDRDQCLAACLAVWLIVDKDLTLSRAVKIAADKHDCKQAPVNRILKDIFPNDYFLKRRNEYMSGATKSIITNKKIAD